MKVLGLTCFGFYNIANALVVPASLSLATSTSNSTIPVLANNSTSNNDPSQVSQLGMPLRHGMAALNNQYDLKFYSLEGSISVKAANQLFYNLYATLLRLWSDSTNRPFQDDIPTSSARYPETVTWIYVHDQRDLTPSLAAAVFWKMLRKCIEELAYWTVEVNTKDHPPTTIAEIDEDYYDPSNLNNLSATNSSSRKATLFSIIPPDISPLSAGARIETHIRYHDAIDNPDPRRLWLSLFLAWNTKPLLNEVPNSIVRPASSDGSIFKVRTAFGEEEAALAMEAKLDLRSSGFEPLTYGELFAGMRGLLESVVATGQFWMLDGVLLKNESGAAGVRVWLDDPGEGEGAVATS